MYLILLRKPSKTITTNILEDKNVSVATDLFAVSLQF